MFSLLLVCPSNCSCWSQCSWLHFGKLHLPLGDPASGQGSKWHGKRDHWWWKGIEHSTPLETGHRMQEKAVQQSQGCTAPGKDSKDNPHLNPKQFSVCPHTAFIPSEWVLGFVLILDHNFLLIHLCSNSCISTSCERLQFCLDMHQQLIFLQC